MMRKSCILQTVGLIMFIILEKVNDLSIMKNLMQEFMIIVQLRRNVFITLCTQGVMRYIY